MVERPGALWARDRDESGFTLIELLVVVIILGILATIVVMAIGNATADTVTATCQTNFREVQSAVDAYKVEEGTYPFAGSPQQGPSFGVQPGDTNAVAALDQADPALAPTGAWIKDTPYLPNHYQIVVSTDGSGTVSVYSAGSAVPDPDNSKTGTKLGDDVSACDLL